MITALTIIAAILLIVKIIVSICQSIEINDRIQSLDTQRQIKNYSAPAVKESTKEDDDRNLLLFLSLFYNECRERNLKTINSPKEKEELMEIAARFGIKDYNSAVEILAAAYKFFGHNSLTKQ